MAGKTREIKGRIKAVANIRRITRTMQLIATARFQAAQKRVTAARPYTRKIAELVGELAAALSTDDADGVTHPLLRRPEPPVNRQLLLVISSNRGLCGGYNANILRTAAAFLRKHAQDQIDLEVVGKKGIAYFRFNRTPVAAVHTQFADKPAYNEVERLADRFIQDYTAGKYDVIRLVYMAFESMSRQRPRVLNLLPLENLAAQDHEQPHGSSLKPQASVQYDFSPDPTELLNELLPITVKTQLYQCFTDAALGEQIARMIAMKSATDAAGKMGKELTRKFNRARQAAITTELSEVISGAAALE